MTFPQRAGKPNSPGMIDYPSILLMIAVTGIILFHSWQARHFQFDDSLIYQRYFSNFFAGKGLVYNEGVHFNGLTAPFYAYLMLVVGSLIRNLQMASWAVSTVSLIAACWLAFRFSSRNSDGLGAAMGLLVGVSLPYFYLTYGMETSLFLALIAACLCLYQDERYGWLALCGTLLVLTRAEGVFLLGVLVLAHCVERRRWPSWRILIAPMLLLLLHYSFNRYYYGAFIPETGSAKIWQGQSGLWGEEHPLFLHSGYLVDFAFLGQRWLVALLAALAAYGTLVTFRRSWIGMVFTLAYIAFYCVLNIPNYHWYFAPILLFMFWHAGIGVSAASARLIPREHKPPRMAWLPKGAAISCSVALAIAILRHAVIIEEPASHYRQAGLWMASHLPVNAQVAMVEIGTVGYYSNRPIIDILGLVNPYNARYIGERKFDAWLDNYHPDYFLVHKPWWPHEVSVRHLLERNRLWIRPDFSADGLQLYCRIGQPDCAPIPSTDLRWHLRTYSTADTQLPDHVALAGGGSIDLVQQDGTALYLTGQLAAANIGDVTVFVATPDTAKSAVIGPLDKTHANDPRFRINLTYDSEAQAAKAATTWCAATQSQDGTLALLSTVRAPCDKLLK